MSEERDYGRQDFGQGGLNDQLDADRMLADIELDRSEIQWRKNFIGFDSKDVRRLERYQDAFDEHAEEIADNFYENLTQHEQTTEVIGRSPKQLEQLKRTQSAYLVTLAEGEYGREYFRDRARIGKIHDLLDMPMKHYIGQYGVYYDLILPLIGDRLAESLVDRISGLGVDTERQTNGDGLDSDADDVSVGTLTATIKEEVESAVKDILAVLRIINLDMQVVTDTYIHAYSEQLETKVAENERLMNDVESQVKEPIKELRNTADEVTESATEITEAAEQQSDQVDEIATEVSELSATVEEVASTAEQVDQSSRRAESLATEGQEAADEAVTVMNDIGTAVESVSSDVDGLQDRVGEIDEFVDAINDIAEQTNMLALNASIEAARAGEAGEGFAVVADEIKSLAQESQDYAGDIELMVDDIQHETDETVSSLKETAEQVDSGITRVEETMANLQKIVESISETADGIAGVAEATDEQAAAAEEIASMIDDVVEQAETVSEEIAELASANEEQAAMVTEVEETVGQLTADGISTDGGQAAVTDDDSTEMPAEDVEIPEDLPDNMPDFVVDMLTEAQLAEVARGELDPSDLL